jgi:ribonuclease BN (tRNA processing enzyme)
MPLDDVMGSRRTRPRRFGVASRRSSLATLLHEAWEPTDAERGHTSGDEAGTIAMEAGVSRLVLTHNHPLPGVPERTAAAAVSAIDGAILEL